MSERSEPTCDEALWDMVTFERSGGTSDAMDSNTQWLADNCDSAFDIFIGYSSVKSQVDEFGTDPCETWVGRLEDEAIALLAEDGLCTTGDAGGPSGSNEDAGQATNLGDHISWDAAAGYIGSTQRVCGPLMSQRYDNDDVFFNIGRDYPDSGRFVIVIWDIGGVEQVAPGSTMCATGTISEYNGIAEIELRDVVGVEVSQ